MTFSPGIYTFLVFILNEVREFGPVSDKSGENELKEGQDLYFRVF